MGRAGISAPAITTFHKSFYIEHWNRILRAVFTASGPKVLKKHLYNILNIGLHFMWAVWDQDLDSVILVGPLQL